MTSPIRSGGISRFRRSNSRTTLTAMSSARVFQKMPCGPARPKAVRTPSTNTTSRRSMPASLRGGFEPPAEILDLPAVRRERIPVVLDQKRAARLELAVAAGIQQAAVRVEPVARRVDGLRRLVVVARVPRLLGEVRQVRDDEVDGLRERLEEISLDHMHAVLDTAQLRVFARELNRGDAGVGRPDLDPRAVDRQRNRHGAAAGADVRDTHRDSVDSLERLVDETFRRRSGSEHLSGGSQQREVVEGRFHKLLPWRTGRSTHGVKMNGTGMARRDCRTPRIRTPASAS